MKNPLEDSISSSLPQQDHVGHRQRLRKRFLDSHGVGIPDYELIELLLFLAQPRTDMKPLAKRLLRKFQSFGAVIAAQPHSLAQIKGMGPSSIAIFKLLHEGIRRILLEELQRQPLLNTGERVVSYCRVCMAHLEVEQFRILFVDKKNFLIADEILQEGTIDQAPIYPRQVLKRALELKASGLIMIHNHPSGDPTPSNADILATKNLQKAAHPLEIRILDHIVIGRFGYVSFREQALL